VDAERRRLSLSLKRVENGHRPPAIDGPMTGIPNLDLSEDVFADAQSAPEAPPLEEDASFEEVPLGEEAVEREAVNEGDEVDPAAADEAVPAEAPVSEEH
jgi:hypothetical protein